MSRVIWPFCLLAAWMLQSPIAPGLCVAAGGPGEAPPEAAPVHRFWSPVHSRHFYTLDEAEKDALLAEYADVWTYEGVAFRAFASRRDDRLAPVHRFWSGALSAHFYTIDDREADSLIVNYPAVWTYEGVGFYAYPAADPPVGTVPVHRFWSGSAGTHFYTISDRERFATVDQYGDFWQSEGVGYYAYPPEDAAAVEIIKGPAVQWVTQESATILWETNVPAGTEIRYGLASADAYVVADPAFVTLHKIVLAGLVPGASYDYTVASGAASRTGAFVSALPPEQPFRFAVYGDTRTHPDVHAQIARNILDSRPQLVLHTGDLVGSGRDLDIWEAEFFEPTAELMAYAPVIPVPGNHEFHGNGPSWYYYFFDRPAHEGWFAFTYGNARFVGLDTNTTFAPGSPQHEWLLGELASADYREATWRVVILHEPPFSATTAHGDNEAVKETLVPLFEQHDVDVVFAGHSHTYERYQYHSVSYIVTGGGGGPLYALRPDFEPPAREFGLTVHHHCVADVDPAAGTLTISAIDIDGHVFESTEFRK